MADEAEYAGTEMKAPTADGGEVLILGHANESDWSVWGPNDQGEFWDYQFGGKADVNGPEGQAAAALAAGHARGLFR